MEPTWGTPDEVLLPAIRVLALVLLVDLFVSLGSLASTRELTSPSQTGEATAGGPRPSPTPSDRAAAVAPSDR